MLYRLTGRQTYTQTDRQTDRNNVPFVLSKKRRVLFWYTSLTVAILTLNDVKFISLTVDHVDIIVVSLSVQRIFRLYA